MPREEAPQVVETDQEADTFAHHVTDVGIPGKVAVEQDTQVTNAAALPYCLATDPHADGWEVSGVLAGAEEKDFRFECVEF